MESVCLIAHEHMDDKPGSDKKEKGKMITRSKGEGDSAFVPFKEIKKKTTISSEEPSTSEQVGGVRTELSCCRQSSPAAAIGIAAKRG